MSANAWTSEKVRHSDPKTLKDPHGSPVVEILKAVGPDSVEKSLIQMKKAGRVDYWKGRSGEGWVSWVVYVEHLGVYGEIIAHSPRGVFRFSPMRTFQEYDDRIVAPRDIHKNRTLEESMDVAARCLQAAREFADAAFRQVGIVIPVHCSKSVVRLDHENWPDGVVYGDWFEKWAKKWNILIND